MTDVEWMEHLGVLKLQDGDTVVVRVGRLISDSEYRELKDKFDHALKQCFPDLTIKVILLERMDIGILRNKEAGNEQP